MNNQEIDAEEILPGMVVNECDDAYKFMIFGSHSFNDFGLICEYKFWLSIIYYVYSDKFVVKKKHSVVDELIIQ